MEQRNITIKCTAAPRVKKFFLAAAKKHGNSEAYWVRRALVEYAERHGFDGRKVSFSE